MNAYEDRWERFLDPEIVKASLFLATMYITTFKILKNSIVDRIKHFYSIGWSEEGLTQSPEYHTEVLGRNASPVYASLNWLHEHEAISEEDLKTFELLKKTRNLLAHQLFEVVWVVNVEIPTNPDYSGTEIDEEGIVPGAILSLQMLLQVAGGSTELLEAWQKGRANQRRSA